MVALVRIDEVPGLGIRIRNSSLSPGDSTWRHRSWTGPREPQACFGHVRARETDSGGIDVARGRIASELAIR